MGKKRSLCLNSSDKEIDFLSYTSSVKFYTSMKIVSLERNQILTKHVIFFNILYFLLQLLHTFIYVATLLSFKASIYFGLL